MPELRRKKLELRPGIDKDSGKRIIVSDSLKQPVGTLSRPVARLLAVGDLHLGRGVRLPEGLEEDDRIDPGKLGAAEVWRRICRRAVAEACDAVLLAGDTIDHSENRFEAVARLQQGVETLSAAGIACLAVAGNHDADALPAVVERLHPLELLGRDGRWECRRLDGNRGTIQVVGWSFPAPDWARSPFENFDRSLFDPACPVVGLLHADLDAASGPYAPVSRAELRASGIGPWLLGHIHAPGMPSPENPGYLGSATALDPSETGPRGPWRVDVFADGTVAMHPLPLAPMRWESLHLDVSSLPGATDNDDGLFAVENALAVQVRARLAEILENSRVEARPELLALRVRLTGTLAGHARIADRLPGLAGLREYRDGILALVAECVDEAGEPLDLRDLARRNSPPGILARQLLAMQRAPWSDPVWRELRETLRASTLRTVLPDASDLWDEPGEASLRGIVMRVGRRRLEELLLQNPSEDAP